MKQKTFAELIEIVKKKRNDYQPEAVEAAEAELELRKQQGEKWEAPQKEVQRKMTSEEKAKLPLSGVMKLFILLVPAIRNLSEARRLRDEGYKRQAVETEWWFFFGLLFYVGLLVILFVFAMIMDHQY